MTTGLGVAAADHGAFRRAQQLFAQALDEFAALPDSADHADCWLRWAAMLTETGQYSEASDAIEQARGIIADLSDDRTAAASLLAVGKLHLAMGRSKDAEAALESALTLAMRRPIIAAARAALGRAYAANGRAAAAAIEFDAAETIFDELSLTDQLADCLLQRAVVAEAAGDVLAARRLAGRSRQIYYDQGLILDAARADLVLARTIAAVAPASLSSLATALETALPAALFIEAGRFQFLSARARVAWSRTLDDMMATIFDWADSLGDAQLVAELIETEVNLGIHRPPTTIADSPRLNRRHSGTARLLANHNLPMYASPVLKLPGNTVLLSRFVALAETRYGPIQRPPGMIRIWTPSASGRQAGYVVVVTRLTEIDTARLLAGAPRYRSRVVVDAHGVDASGTWTTPHGDILRAAPGDWWVTDGKDRWSVGRDIFAATYSRSDDGRFRKTATVVAVQLEHDFVLDTPEGQASGLAGDWLVRNDTGESWPVDSATFARRYEPE